MTNHYKVLGVSNTASQAEIRISFRNLALRYHPDRNNNSEESKQKFMQIVEAYEVLSDPQSRRNYDGNMYYHYGSYNYTPRSRKRNYSRNFDRLYRYAKRRYENDLISRSSDMRYIGKTTSAGIRKAPMILFRSLSSVIRSASVTTSAKE